MKLSHFLSLIFFFLGYAVTNRLAAEPANHSAVPVANSIAHFAVRSYAIEGHIHLPVEVVNPLLARYTGTNISLEDIVRAAADLQAEYRRQGYPGMSVSIVRQQITDGVVTLHVFPAVLPQIFVSGERYLVSSNGVSIAMSPLVIDTGSATNLPTASVTATTASDTTSTNATNAGPKFHVKSYLVSGNSLLSPNTIKNVLVSHTGTNVAVADIVAAGLDLQKEYRARGYPTVNVTLPQQRIGTNGQVKLQVFEGRLANVIVSGNHYFSSNNVVRALPSLHTNQILNGPVFQAELNRANANQDRQIYPRIEPGPDENTTTLRLDVKDRLPLHAKMELNNESSPGTPGLRLNSSAVYNNLWQLEHSLGVQYGFSPEEYKQGEKWNFYDLPLVANYSAFYRLPLGNPSTVEDVVASDPGSFGYSEATRQFRLPPPSGQPELTFFASRATIDSGVTTLSERVLANNPGVLSFSEATVHEDLTVNNDVGTKLTLPLNLSKTSANFNSGFSGGLDYKTYDVTSYETNLLTITQVIAGANGSRVSSTETTAQPLPVNDTPLEYLPLSLGYNANWRIPRATFNFGLGLNVNSWYSGSRSNLQNITFSSKSSGHWVTLDPTFSAEIIDYTNWVLVARASAQWASEPLISNEQFGAGGVNSVRGYREGEVFGDTGWRVSLEQQTPPHVVGYIHGNVPLTIRGSLYMDYATVYLLDPRGRQDSTPLWGTGVGAVASLGSHWEARFLFSVPLLGTSTTSAYQPFFNFALTGQF